VKAVVSIEATVMMSQGQQRDPFFEFFGYPQGYGGGSREARAGGSGVIISEDGYIVTNNHVIENAKTVKVKLPDGRVFDGRIIGSDPSTDVALVKIEAENLPTIPFGSSDDLRLGEWVLAIGYPMDLQSTITAGIVSAKARSLGAIDNRNGIEAFIQTDAAVNPGNSGGALVNSRGELVGINTIIKTSTGGYMGYSFAVPVSIVSKVVVDLKESGVVQRAVLGLSFRAVDQQFIDQMGEQTGISRIGGIYVASVAEDGAASKAGIRKGDVITHIEGVEINDNATLLEQIGKRRPGDKVRIRFIRDGREASVVATLQNRAGETSLLESGSVVVAQMLGGKLVTAPTSLCRQLDIRGGIQVQKLDGNGLLQRARVREGFVITHINDRAVYSVEDLDKLTTKIRSIDGIYPNGRASSYVIVE
jgi:Do/DeqQ family serine protease